MSGHNKWSKVKHKKEVKDKVKGNIFSKLARLITLAVIEGGGVTDPANNLKLRLAMEKAKSYNIPKDNIDRAIQNGVGPDKSQLKEILYEAFALGGIGLLIMSTSDNSNRTTAEIKNILEKHSGKLGTVGSVAHLFLRCGLIKLDKKKTDQSQALNKASELEALDLEEKENSYLLYFPSENLHKIENNEAEIIFKPQSKISVDSETKGKIIGLIEELESLDDVHKVYANCEI